MMPAVMYLLQEDSIWRYFANKDWSIYPFIPPTLSIFLSIFLVPMYDKLYGGNLRRYLRERLLLKRLEGRGSPDALGDDFEEEVANLFEMVMGIAKERGLQIAYLTGILSFVSSVITTLKSNHPIALGLLLFILFFVGLALLLHVLLREVGYLSTTMFPESQEPAFLDRRQWTYLKFFTHVLTAFNVVLIIIIILALPEKPAPCAPCPAP